MSSDKTKYITSLLLGIGCCHWFSVWLPLHWCILILKHTQMVYWAIFRSFGIKNYIN